MRAAIIEQKNALGEMRILECSLLCIQEKGLHVNLIIDG